MNLSSRLSSVVFSTAVLSAPVFGASGALADVPVRPNMDSPVSASTPSESAGIAATGAVTPGSETTAQDNTPAARDFPKFSDGRVLEFADLGMQITPPVGWEVSHNTGGISLILREPQAPVEVGKTSFARNITVATMHRASPIDEQRATELKEQLKSNFGKDGLVSEYNVLEHKFFDYRGKNDGLLVYASLKIGQEPMMQMHVLVSGGEKQFLLTYTDLAQRFNDQADKGFENAWKAMTSIAVSGATPSRIEGYYKYFALAGGLGFVGFVLMFLRRKAKQHDFDSEANALEDSEGDALTHSLMATLAYGWKLDAPSNRQDSSAEMAGQGSRYTSAVSFVSNY